MLKMLLEHGADPNVRSTAKNQLLIHPLEWDAIFGRCEAADLLLKYGADVNADFGLEMENDVMKRATALDVAEIMLYEIALRGYEKNSRIFRYAWQGDEEN